MKLIMDPALLSRALEANRAFQASLRLSIDDLDSIVAATTAQIRDLEATLAPVAPPQPKRRRVERVPLFQDPVTGEKPPLCAAAQARREVAAMVQTAVGAASVGADGEPSQPWAADEERRLIEAVEAHGGRDWRCIAQDVAEGGGASSSSSSRSPFEVFQHYQQSLNPDLSRGPWTEEEDRALTAAVQVTAVRLIRHIPPCR